MTYAKKACTTAVSYIVFWPAHTNFGSRMTKSDIDIKLLRAFVSVATEQSFTAAARLAGCSQGAVSTRVRALEGQLGVRLFNRARLNVRLTPAGQDLFPRARALLDRHDRLFLDARSRTVAGTVRVGVAEGFGMPLLAELLERVREHYAAVRLEIVCDVGCNLKRTVEAGSLDLALAVLGKEAPSATVLGRPRLQWVGAPDFAFGEDEPILVASYPEGCPVRASALSALEDRGVAYRLALSTWSDRVLDNAVRSGWAIAAMPENLVPEGLKVLNRPSLLPRLDRIDIQLLERPGLDDEAASVVGREIVDIYHGR